MNYPNRVWTITQYIDERGNSCCDYDDPDATPMWSSHEPSDDDRLRRRKATLEATKRLEQRKARVTEVPLEPLRRQG